MKKVTLLTAFVTVCSFAFAQTKMAQVQHLPLSKKVKSFPKVASKPTSISNGAMYAKKAIIWSEDFAGGIPVGWTNTGTPAAALWEYRGLATTPNNTVGGRGDCSGGTPIASPTAANGFMIFDSNYLDDGVFCGGGNSGVAPTPHIGTLQTDAINLSVEPSVMLTFYTDMRGFQGTQSVNVSTDGGVAWTQVWEAGLGANEFFADLVSVNITCIVANQADVRLQFVFDGDYYEWMIDDITLETTPDYDLALVTDSDMVYLNPWQTPIYGKIPINQTGITNFAARVVNVGKLAQTNVVLNVDVNDGVSSVFNSSNTLPLLDSCSNSSLFTITQGFSPNGTGIHTITFTVNSDSTDGNLSDNSDTISYEVTDTVFARDNDAPQFELNVATYGVTGPTPNGSSYEFGNLYEIVNAATATSISVVFGASTIVGTVVQGKIYAADGITLLGSTAFYTIQAGDVGAFPIFPTTTIPLTAPLGLGDTSNYIVTIADYSGTDIATTIIASDDGHLFATSFLNYSAGLAYIAETPFVRLNLASCVLIPISVTINTTDATCGNCDGVASISFSGGIPPYTYSWNTSPVQMDSSATGLCSGIYMVTVRDSSRCIYSDTAIVNEVCGNNVITGYVFDDINSDCIVDSGESGLFGWIVKAEPGPHYGYTDANGFYKIYVDTGTYTVSQVTIDPDPYRGQVCPVSPNSYPVTFTIPGDTSFDNNFGNQTIVFCPHLSVDIATGAVRPCFNANYSVSYCNHGTIAAINSTIEVELDDSFTYISTTGNLISQNGNILTFDIGTVNPGQCSLFRIYIYVTCDMSLVGSTMCVKAHIYPDSSCFPADSTWDKSSVEVVGSCTGDSLACFTITNTGDPGEGDMQGTSEYRIYENNILVHTGTFQIDGGNGLIICWPANGNTIRLEADQRPGHPGNSHPQDNVELCGGPPFITGQITLVPEDDQDDFVEIDCRVATGSYDPNDKQVKPEGLTQAKYIDSTDVLEYLIRFQNTGTDTAFKVVIRDTLSAYVDITTIQPGASSHQYTLDILGSNILQWTFENILLPDSNVDEPASNGFVKFKIHQQPGNIKGTVIENNAGIVFDFNEPVITNTVFNTIGKIDPIIIPGLQKIYDKEVSVRVYPNPFNSTTTFEINSNSIFKLRYTFELYNIIGEQVKEVSDITDNKFIISRENLPGGIYIYKINSKNGLIGAGKLVVN